MNDSLRARAKALFFEALDRPPRERESFLRSRCGANPELLEEVFSLISAGDAAEGFLDTRHSDGVLEEIVEAVADPLAGTRIGQFRILDLLGRGGMGAVYRAEQDQPHREVALKLVDRLFASPESLRRLEVEAEVLARLHHPGIAHVYDAGVTQTQLGRRPYFAMELIRGLPITHFARERGLGEEQRIELVIRVCDAVQHAHRVGVIHRDLKPANILVTEEGQPKILDFGIARTTGTDLQVTTLAGSTPSLIGTLPYMSPEQVRGRPEELDTRSDVYSLGVVCFELLAGAHPRNLEDKPLTEAIQIIVQQPPSSLRTAAGRRFAADLETILATALESDKERRYGSASDLAGDLRRYLDGQPITARPQGALYHFSKLVRRNRLASVLVAGLLLLSVGAAVVTGLLARRSARERDRASLEAKAAREVSTFLESLFLAADPGEALGESWTARDLLDKGAVRIAGELEGQPIVRGRMLTLLGRVYDNLGDPTKAESLLAEAVNVGRSIAREDEEGAGRADLDEALRLLARQRGAQGSDQTEALALCREALEFSGRVFGERSLQYATSLNSLAYHLALAERFQESRVRIEEGLEIRESLLGPIHVDVGWSRYQYGWLLYSMEEFGKAQEQLEQACEIWERTYPDNHPQIATCLFDLGRFRSRVERYDDALALYERALAMRRRTLGPDHEKVGETLINCGYVQWRRGEYELAYRRYEEALATYRRAGSPDNPGVLKALVSLAYIARQTHRLREEEEALAERLEVARAYHADQPRIVAEAEKELADFRARTASLTETGGPAALSRD